MKIILETNRLILRPWNIDDATSMFYGWASDIEVAKYVTWNPHKNIDETRFLLNKWIEEYKKEERINFAITLKSDNTLIGGIDVVGYINGPKGTPIIGYNLSRRYWNKGYMTEACRCLLDYLFSKGYKEVRIDADIRNTASIRVIEKCGGVLVSTEEEDVPLKNTKVIVNRYIVRNNK